MTAHKSLQTTPKNLLIAIYPSNPISILFHPIPAHNKDPHFTACHYATPVFSCGHPGDCLRHRSLYHVIQSGYVHTVIRSQRNLWPWHPAVA
jgi:hypothetical protein